jgi:hypothetical protein
LSVAVDQRTGILGRLAQPLTNDVAREGGSMSDTKALEEFNREIVKLVDELSSMKAKQDRLQELMRQRGELEQRLLGLPAEVAPRAGGRRRSNGAERADEPTPVSTN